MYIGLYVKYRHYFQIIMKLEFSVHSFEKFLNIIFYENLPCESRVVPCGRAEGHDEANSRFSQFCERA